MSENIMTVPEMLRYRSDTEPDSRAFNFVDLNGPVETMTARDIYTLAGKFASRIRHYGFQEGDVIANGLPNSPERLITDMGVIMAGCVVVNCQVVEKDGSNFFNVARMSKCRGVIIPNRTSKAAHYLLSSHIPSNAMSSPCFSLTLPQAPSIEKAILVDRVQGDSERSLLDSLRSSNEEILDRKPSPSDLAALFATSGSSGFSKLVPYNHETIFNQGRVFVAIKGITSFTDRPMGWIGGFPFDFLSHGSERFVQDQFEDNYAKTNAELWQVIARTKCQGAALLPGAIYELVDLFKNNPPESKLQFVTTGGQCMRYEIVKALGLLCHAIVVSYGATEAGISCYKVITDPSHFKDFQCGKPMKDVVYKIIDDDAKEVEIGTVGNLVMKCPRLLPQYYNVETETQPSDIYTPDGFYKTGDRAKLDSEGNFYCFGRCGDVISIGAHNIYLSWPEGILTKCPFLQDACIVSLEEKNGNAILCACIIPSIGEDVTESRVKDYFEQAIITDDQGNRSIPRLSHVFMMEKFPLLPSGKINKLYLRKIIHEKLDRPRIPSTSTS